MYQLKEQDLSLETLVRRSSEGKLHSPVHYTLLAERFKLLAHPERLRILDALRREPECVCHLEALLQRPQPYVSQQLRILREANVILDEKRGNNVYYRLIDDGVGEWLACALGPVSEADPELAFYKGAIVCECPKCEEPDKEYGLE